MYVIDTDKQAAQLVQERRDRLGASFDSAGPGCLPMGTAYRGNSFLRPAYELNRPIPREDWIPMIRDGIGDFLHDHRADKIDFHNQGSTNFCWTHGTVRSLEVLRIYQGQRPVMLSGESVAVPLTHGRNRGGSADEAIQRLNSHGACEQRYWPLNDRNINHAKDGWLKNAELYQCIKWLSVLGWDFQVTLALHRIPVPIGLGWWGHLVCQMSPVELDSKTVGILFDNSWGNDWGDDGTGVLDEQHGTADLGAVAPVSATFAI